MRCLNEKEVKKAFELADRKGSALLGFINHDFRDMEPDIEWVRNLIATVKNDYPDVKFKFCEVRETFNRTIFGDFKKPETNILSGKLDETSVEDQWKLTVEASEDTFGPQPFLAEETKDGRFHHDNFDFQRNHRRWSYIFDEHTFPMETIKNFDVATNDRRGFFQTLLFQRNMQVK